MGKIRILRFPSKFPEGKAPRPPGMADPRLWRIKFDPEGGGHSNARIAGWFWCGFTTKKDHNDNVVMKAHPEFYNVYTTEDTFATAWTTIPTKGEIGGGDGWTWDFVGCLWSIEDEA